MNILIRYFCNKLIIIKHENNKQQRSDRHVHNMIKNKRAEITNEGPKASQKRDQSWPSYWPKSHLKPMGRSEVMTFLVLTNKSFEDVRYITNKSKRCSLHNEQVQKMFVT